MIHSAQYRGATKNCLCTNLADRDASSRTICDPEASSCTGAETCECYQGAILPVSSGGAPGCIINRFSQPLTGTVNVALTGPHAGESDLAIRAESAVHNGLGLAKPCPQCVGDPVFSDGVKGGTCDVGLRAGQPCDVAGTHDLFSTVTFDCPPFVAANIGYLDIRAPHETTGTSTLPRGTRCTGMAGECACNTCATAGAEPCNGNADCPPGIICGGRRCIGGSNNGTPCTNNTECPGALCNRPGEPSMQNSCIDGVCTLNPSDPNGTDEGICESGPVDRLCSIEKFRSCTGDSDCNPPPSGGCADCASGQVCEISLRQCFPDPIVAHRPAGRADGEGRGDVLHDAGRERLDQQGERLARTGHGPDPAPALLRARELRQQRPRRERGVRHGARRRVSGRVSAGLPVPERRDVRRRTGEPAERAVRWHRRRRVPRRVPRRLHVWRDGLRQRRPRARGAM